MAKIWQESTTDLLSLQGAHRPVVASGVYGPSVVPVQLPKSCKTPVGLVGRQDFNGVDHILKNIKGESAPGALYGGGGGGDAQWLRGLHSGPPALLRLTLVLSRRNLRLKDAEAEGSHCLALPSGLF